MGIFRVIFFPRSKSASTPEARPLSSVRRKYLYKGSKYDVAIAHGTRNSLRIDNATFHVTLKEMNAVCFEDYIDGWYRRAARREFVRICETMTQRMGIAMPQIKIFKMKRAWGRCYYQKGIVTLNLHLIKTPEQCIEYIILHELCHFTHHNHSAAFYDMVSFYDPQWKCKDQLLKDFSRSEPTILQKLHI